MNWASEILPVLSCAISPKYCSDYNNARTATTFITQIPCLDSYIPPLHPLAFKSDPSPDLDPYATDIVLIFGTVCEYY